jgi:hypothetical protein
MSKTAAILVSLAAMLAASPAASAERTLSVTSFDRIRVDGPFKVTLTTGVAPFARVTGSSSAIDRVSVDVQGRTLVVRPSLSSWGGYPGEATGPAEIVLGTHDLSQAWLNGAGSLSIDRVRGLTFGFDLQGSGSVAIANMDVDQLRVGLNGAGSATLAGKAPKLTAIVRGVSSLDASALQVKDAAIGAEGPAQVKASVTGTLKLDARGTSTIDIAGTPACTVTAQGSATVTGCN